MCGIVGYSGSRDAIKIVLEGLSHLEYRGYDSAGISYKINETIQTQKESGRLEVLQKKMNSLNVRSNLAIGHTRWATHGVVNSINAHPHDSTQISIVHNGIIENASELKESLENQGVKFNSETDSEVFLKLIEVCLKNNKTTLEAVSWAFKQIKGNSAFVVLSKQDNILYGIKRKAPLVCGIGRDGKELFLSSDPYALVGIVDTLVFPEDSVIFLSNTDKESQFIFKELDGSTSKRFTKQNNQLNLPKRSKKGFKHFMLKEIFEQPVLVKNLYQNYASQKEQKRIQNLLTKKSIEHISIVACGTAYYAGLVLKNYLMELTTIKVSVDYASEFRYSNYKPLKKEIGLLISQSGETADTLACLDLFSQHQIPKYSILNVEGSTLSRQSDANFFIHAGVEIGVASTKAFTLQVLMGLIFSSFLRYSKIDTTLEQEFLLLSEKINTVLKQSKHIKKIAQEISNSHGFIFTGRQDHYPIALEGSLKMKEITYIQSQGYPAGELKHGPISLVDKNMVNIALLSPLLFDKTLSNLQEVYTRGGKIVAIGNTDHSEVIRIADYSIKLDYTGLKYTAPLLSNVVLQLLSYYVARNKGTDIDKPRNLAKSVTVE